MRGSGNIFTAFRKHTSVSSVFCKSALLPGPSDVDVRRQNDEEGDMTLGWWDRCNPAFSRSISDQDKIEESNDSISKRLASARGVVRKERRTLVTSLLSTFVSEEFLRSRRSASIRCSLIMTAINVRVTAYFGMWSMGNTPSCRSLLTRTVFSFTSFSSSCARELFVCDSSRLVYREV